MGLAGCASGTVVPDGWTGTNVRVWKDLDHGGIMWMEGHDIIGHHMCRYDGRARTAAYQYTQAAPDVSCM